MIRTSILAGLAALAAAGVSMVIAADTPGADKPVPPVLNFTMKTLQSGEDQKLSTYQGKVILMVNVASKCGYTPQYEGLESMYTRYKDKGLVILGFPANDFGAQEPGTSAEIAEFCKATYGVNFPMFSKVTVLGANKTPLYKYLTDDKNDPTKGGEVKWNFEKFLISKDGKIVNRWRSAVTPESDEVVKAVEAELGK